MNHKIIDYYLDSLEFEASLLAPFLIKFGHDLAYFDAEGVEYTYCSAVSLATYSRAHSEHGFVLSDQYKTRWLLDYCITKHDDVQRFCVMFGIWYGLEEKCCRMMSAKGRQKLAPFILNALLCGLTYEEVNCVLEDKNASLADKRQRLAAIEWNGCCKVCPSNSNIQPFFAMKHGNVLISQSDSREYVVNK